MRYPIAIEPGTARTAFGVVVPDLPGCFSAGDTLDEAIANAEEAIAGWIDVTLDSGERIPPASTLDTLRELDAYKGWIFGFITVDPALMDDSVERVNITLPRRVLSRLDAAADAVGDSRSGFIARMTLLAGPDARPGRKAKVTAPARASARIKGTKSKGTKSKAAKTKSTQRSA
jgi:predicted RNase H-like HicB family nuclease